jgi:uncharacterized protein YgiM (DUF1202 family)
MRINGAVFLFTLLLLSLLTLSGTAQDVEHEDIFQTALAITTKNCEGLRRNEACYGHALLSAEPHPGVETFNFDSEGDIVSLADTQSIKLSGLNPDTGTWGVALMQLRANLPSSHTENVTVVAFGDVELTNAVKPPTQVEIQARASQNINVRAYPSLDSLVIGTIASDQTVTALERLEDSSWLRVQMPDSDQTGWVFSELLTVVDDIQALNVTYTPSRYYQPMQAFYFRSGSGDSEFTAVPDSGLLIQTPEGVGEVQLLINEINIQLGSTVFFQAEPDGMMTISTIEGHADIVVGDVEQTAFDGTTVSIPLDANLKPKGAPDKPKPYDEEKMKKLPLDTLNRKVDVKAARSDEEITQLIEQKEATATSTDGVSPTAPAATPPAETTAEVTPDLFLTAEVTPEVESTEELTPEVSPTESSGSESTPDVSPTETSDPNGESTAEPQSDESGGDAEGTPETQADESRASGGGSESTPDVQSEEPGVSDTNEVGVLETAFPDGDTSTPDPEATPEPEPDE